LISADAKTQSVTKHQEKLFGKFTQNSTDKGRTWNLMQNITVLDK